MTTIDPIALIHQIEALEAKHAALMAEMLEAMDKINELRRSKNMPSRFHLKNIDAHVLTFECQSCGAEIFAQPGDEIEATEQRKAAHECHDPEICGCGSDAEYCPFNGYKAEAEPDFIGKVLESGKRIESASKEC